MSEYEDLEFLIGKRGGGNARRNILAVCKQAPEVMVKNTGAKCGGVHFKKHADYISREGAIELEDDAGNLYFGKEDVAELAASWTETLPERSAKTRDSISLVFSVPGNIQAKDADVLDSVRELAKKSLGWNYHYAFALHTDTDNPHVHLDVLCAGHDGRRFHMSKETSSDLRAAFAEQLRKRGIEVAASSRYSRFKPLSPLAGNNYYARRRGTYSPAAEDFEKKKIKEARKVWQKAGLKAGLEGDKEMADRIGQLLIANIKPDRKQEEEQKKPTILSPKPPTSAKTKKKHRAR